MPALHLNGIQTDRARRAIARVCGLPTGGILVHSNGLFEMYGLNQYEKDRACQALLRNEHIEDLTSFEKTNYSKPVLRNGRLDFEHRYTVRGRISDPTFFKTDIR